MTMSNTVTLFKELHYKKEQKTGRISNSKDTWHQEEAVCYLMKEMARYLFNDAREEGSLAVRTKIFKN